MAPDPHRQRVIAEISEALTQLLGRDISVAPAGSPEPTELVVRYVDGSGGLVSAWTVEKGLAFALGGALMMVPRSIVDEAIQSGTETSQLEENFREVVNVLATTAANVLQRRAVLESVSEDKSELMRTVRQVRAGGGSWSVLEVGIDGYPGGRIAVSLVPSDAE